VICWGSNGYGQLGTTAPGDSATAYSKVAVAAAPGLTTSGISFSSLSAGEHHTCGITTGGQAYCWGRNDAGQLGDPATVAAKSTTPVQVGGGHLWRSVAAGELFTCGVVGSATSGGTTATGGTVYCWGDNEYGQVGQRIAGASGQPVRTPTVVKGQQSAP
jgi:alpha-tubulin suppressor-like RCC1 family protein